MSRTPGRRASVAKPASAPRRGRAAMDSPQALPSGALGLRANAKINLHLEVLRQRPDGWHSIETVFQSVGLYDTLHLVPRPGRDVRMLCDVPGLSTGEDNLCRRAATALLEAAGLSQPPAGVRIDLYKRIPVAAGFAGGSADAAATLVGLNRLWKLSFDTARLSTVAACLGSDVPFCLQGGTAYASGRGEHVERLPDLPQTVFLLLFPKIPVAAAWAYAHLNMGLTRRPRTLSMNRLKSILAQYPKAASVFYNRLEDAVAPAYPKVGEITTGLLQLGASVAMMSGSGAGIFGVFPNRQAAEAAQQEMRRSDWPSWVVGSRRQGVESFSDEK